MWAVPEKWEDFKKYLRSVNEGEDSEGKELSMERYSHWLECYSKLDRRGEMEVLNEMEQFLDRERGIKCIDSGMRKEVKAKLKAVREGTLEPSTHVWVIAYPRVVEKLSELLGNYQNKKKEEEVNEES